MSSRCSSRLPGRSFRRVHIEAAMEEGASPALKTLLLLEACRPPFPRSYEMSLDGSFAVRCRSCRRRQVRGGDDRGSIPTEV